MPAQEAVPPDSERALGFLSSSAILFKQMTKLIYPSEQLPVDMEERPTECSRAARPSAGSAACSSPVIHNIRDLGGCA